MVAHLRRAVARTIETQGFTLRYVVGRHRRQNKTAFWSNDFLIHFAADYLIHFAADYKSLIFLDQLPDLLLQSFALDQQPQKKRALAKQKPRRS